MALYRYGSSEYKKQKQRLLIGVIGSITLLIVVLLFGLPILEGFSLLVDRLRGVSPTTQTTAIIQSPVLDPLDVATNSAALTISGYGNPNATIIIFLNDEESKQLKAQEDGTFKAAILGKAGDNRIYAVTRGENNETSSPSNTVSVSVIAKNPNLDISKPEENATFLFEETSAVVEGKTDIGNTIRINERVIIVQSDGSFRSSVQLSEGENIIKVEAVDIAGNSTIVERKVIYQK